MSIPRERPLADAAFADGWTALNHAFPTLAEHVSFSPFYVCPLCLHAFGRDAIQHRVLTFDHVPPRSVGGKRLVLTCKKCNSTAGHAVDAHVGRESDFVEFMSRGTVTNRRATLTTPVGTIPVRLSTAAGGITVAGVPTANPQAHRTFFTDFERIAGGGNWGDFTFQVGFEPFSEPRAALSWLRSAYLMFFAVFGYRFIFRPEIEAIRLKILRADIDAEPTRFRMVQPAPSPPTLARIEEPVEARCYAMLYRHNVVFLPKHGDATLYERLLLMKKGAVISGMQYEWPRRPRYAADIAANPT